LETYFFKHIDVKNNVNNYYARNEVLKAVVMKNFVFWNIKECSPLKVNPRFVALLAAVLTLRWFLAENRGDIFPETSVDFQRTTRPYIPEVIPLHLLRRSLHASKRSQIPLPLRPNVSLP
jgi:hypothetical protein